MENYTYVLLKIYKSIYKFSFVKEIKDMYQTSRKRGRFFLILFVVFSIFMIGSLLFGNQKLSLVSAFLFLINTFILGVEYTKHPYPEELRRSDWEDKLYRFDELLLAYGLINDTIINECIDFIQSDIESETKKRERTHDVLFKYFVTFLLSVFIFFGKEFWNRIEKGIPSDVIFSIILFIIILILFYLMLWLSGFISVIKNKKTDYENLVSSLKGVLLFRSGVKLKVIVEEIETNTVTRLLEEK